MPRYTALRGAPLVLDASGSASDKPIVRYEWDLAYDGSSNVVDAYVSRVRDAVDKPFDAPLIETVRGVGYRLRG